VSLGQQKLALVLFSGILFVMFLFGCASVIHFLIEGAYSVSSHRVIYRENNPGLFWMKTAMLSVGTLIIGALSVVLFLGYRQVKGANTWNNRA
jgi:hypothetical protein